MKFLTIILFLISLCLLNVARAATSQYCIENERIAKKTAETASEREAWAHRAIGGGIGGASCSILFILAAVDGGITAAICTAVAGGAGAASVDPDLVAKVYNETYNKLKDKQCPS